MTEFEIIGGDHIHKTTRSTWVYKRQTRPSRGPSSGPTVRAGYARGHEEAIPLGPVAEAGEEVQ